MQRRFFFIAIALLGAFSISTRLSAGVLIRFDESLKGAGTSARVTLLKEGAQRIRSFTNIGWESWAPPSGTSDAAFAASLKMRPGIKNISLPTRITLFDTFPDDPEFLTWQWALYYADHPEFDIDAPRAWDITTGTAEIIVAVIDSGIDSTHPDLTPNLWHNPAEIPDNGIDDDKNGFIDDAIGWDFINDDNLPDDALGHGTHVSGIIGARGNNGIGVSGVCWRINIMPLKVFQERETTDEVIVAAFDYVLGQEVNVINASWGGTIPSPPIKDAIRECNRRGILFVAAAGNDLVNTVEHPIYPACHNLPNIISVAASTLSGTKAHYSNFGPLVSVCAPGSSIYSTLPAPQLYGNNSGTSMAAPHVTGTAALLLSADPYLSPEEIRNRVIGSAQPVEILETVSLSGGLLNAGNLFSDDGSPPAPITDLCVTAIGLTTATLQFSLPADDEPDDKVKTIEVRRAAFYITPQNWWDAHPIGALIETGKPGETRIVQVSALSPGMPYFFAARSLDEGGNPSPLSNIASARTLPAHTIYYEDFEDGAPDWNISTSDWDIPTSPDAALSGKRLLAHHEKPHSPLDNDAAISPWIDLASDSEPYLAWSQEYEFFGFQRFTNQGHIEVQAEGESQWEEVGRLTMFHAPWHTQTIYLGKWRGRRIRFRFNYYHFFNTEEHPEILGWRIDDVKILDAGKPSPQPALFFLY